VICFRWKIDGDQLVYFTGCQPDGWRTNPVCLAFIEGRRYSLMTSSKFRIRTEELEGNGF
jgi:hypothetical protein